MAMNSNEARRNHRRPPNSRATAGGEHLIDDNAVPKLGSPNNRFGGVDVSSGLYRRKRLGV
jgi:hypothetical protein